MKVKLAKENVTLKLSFSEYLDLRRILSAVVDPISCEDCDMAELKHVETVCSVEDAKICLSAMPALRYDEETNGMQFTENGK